MTKDVTIHIKPPLKKGNLPILYYQYNVDGGLWRTVMPHRLPIVVRDLEINNMYNVNIRAVNKDGASDNQTIEVTPTGTPDSPIINNIEYTNNHIEIYYTLGSDNGSEITDVEYRISGQRFISSNLQNPIIINRGFRFGRNELISLRSKNKNGYSDAVNDDVLIPTIQHPPNILSFSASGGEDSITINWNIDDGGSALTSIEYELEEII